MGMLGLTMMAVVKTQRTTWITMIWAITKIIGTPKTIWRSITWTQMMRETAGTPKTTWTRNHDRDSEDEHHKDGKDGEKDDLDMLMDALEDLFSMDGASTLAAYSVGAVATIAAISF